MADTHYKRDYCDLYLSIDFIVPGNIYLEIPQYRILDVFIKRIQNWHSSAIEIVRNMISTNDVNVEDVQHVFDEFAEAFTHRVKVSKAYSDIIEELYARPYRKAVHEHQNYIKLYGNHLSLNVAVEKIKTHWVQERDELRAFLSYYYRIIGDAIFGGSLSISREP